MSTPLNTTSEYKFIIISKNISKEAIASPPLIPVRHMLFSFNGCVLSNSFYRTTLCIRGIAMTLCPSVCPSQVGVLLKRLNVESHKQYHTVAQGLLFSEAKHLREIPPGSPPTGAPNAGGVGKSATFDK